MNRPRYRRTRQAHCIYTKRTHLYLFVSSKQSHGYVESGVCVKRWRRDRLWRHTSFYVARKRDDDGTLLARYEIVTHVSEELRGGRIHHSKRYLRFKVCL